MAGPGGINNWTIPTDGAGHMRAMQKRLARTERQPRIANASDLLGPGIDSKAVQIYDWNSDEVAFNGFYFSEPGSMHSPDDSAYWMGMVLVNEDGYGLQRVWEYREGTSRTMRVAERKVFTAPGALTNFTGWVFSGGKGQWIAAPLANGWTNYPNNRGAAYSIEAGVVSLRGVVQAGNTSAPIFSLPEAYWPPVAEVCAAASQGLTSGGPSAGTAHTHSLGHAATYISVSTTGQVTTSPVVTGWVSLSNTRFETF